VCAGEKKGKINFFISVLKIQIPNLAVIFSRVVSYCCSIKKIQNTGKRGKSEEFTVIVAFILPLTSNQQLHHSILTLFYWKARIIL